MKTIRINGVDYSSYFTRYTYAVSYKKVKGNAGGTMLDGTTTDDTIAVKATITLPVAAFKEEELAMLISSLYSSDYPIVEYFDTRAKAYRTIETRMDDAKMSYLLENVYGDTWWKFDVLKLTER